MDPNPPGVPVASSASGSRKGTTKPFDPNRFYCPFPGCNRSFAELWRLKVHYRAPPDVRGSGKERGHGAELPGCPKCGMELKPGKHHVGCFGGRKTARSGARRPSKGEVAKLTSHLGQLGGLAPADETSRKKARTGAPSATARPPQAEMVLPQPAVRWESMPPEAMAMQMPVAASVVPSGPCFMDFSQFSRTIQTDASTLVPGHTQSLHTMGADNSQFSTYVCGNVGEAPVMATTRFSYDQGFCNHPTGTHQQGVQQEAPGPFAGYAAQFIDQKGDLMQGPHDGHMMGMAPCCASNVLEPMQTATLAGQPLGHFSGMDGMERSPAEFWPLPVNTLDANRGSRLEAWVPHHLAGGEAPAVGLAHQQPPNPGDLGAATDIVFPHGSLDPLPYTLSDMDGRRKDVPG